MNIGLPGEVDMAPGQLYPMKCVPVEFCSWLLQTPECGCLRLNNNWHVPQFLAT